MNPYYAYNKMKDLLRNKANGVDCSEEESAEIKTFVKQTIDRCDFSTNMLRMNIERLFPLEYSEALEEIENNH